MTHLSVHANSKNPHAHKRPIVAWTTNADIAKAIETRVSDTSAVALITGAELKALIKLLGNTYIGLISVWIDPR
jgi:hypothetical protein